MSCNRHRCFRRLLPPDLKSLDYVLMAANDADLVEGAATVLRGAGVETERHDLGMRLNCRGTDWRAALGHLADALSAPARRGLRVALIPISADTLAFHKALLMSHSLDTITAALAPQAAVTTPVTNPVTTPAFGDVFKGESLE